MPTDVPIAYSLQEYGFAEPIKILGAVTKLLPSRDVPIVFLIDETHAPDCIKQNLLNAKELIDHCGVSFAGVESQYGGYKWDDCYRHQYTQEFDKGDNPTAANEYPQFAEGIRKLGLPALGVECQGLSNELECNRADNPPPPPIKDRVFNIARSKHFIRTLFQLRSKHSLGGNLILNAGGNHNSHIANWIQDGIIESIAGEKAAYVRLRAPAYKE